MILCNNFLHIRLPCLKRSQKARHFVPDLCQRLYWMELTWKKYLETLFLSGRLFPWNFIFVHVINNRFLFDEELNSSVQVRRVKQTLLKKYSVVLMNIIFFYTPRPRLNRTSVWSVQSEASAVVYTRFIFFRPTHIGHKFCEKHSFVVWVRHANQLISDFPKNSKFTN